MWKTVLAGTAALAIVGASAVYAQQQGSGPAPTRWQPSQEDMAAFAAARIAALKAGLVLTPEQEKLWPAYESAVKDLSRYRMERRAMRRNEQPQTDPMQRLRRRAEMLSDLGAALKKLADAQEPLYSSLNDAQKRRFAILQRVIRHAGRGPHRGMRQGMGGDRGHWRGEGWRHGEHRRWRDRADLVVWHRGRDADRGPAPQGDQDTTKGTGERL
jgi:hypothetical protein